MKKRILVLTAAVILLFTISLQVSAAETEKNISVERPYAEMLLNLCSAIREKGYDSIDHYAPEKISADSSVRPDTGEYLFTKWMDAGQGGSDLRETLFAFTDLNEDGVRELVLTGAKDNVDVFCTIDGGEVKVLTTYAYRNTAKIRGKYIVAESGTSGEDAVSVFMTLSDNGELDVVDGYSVSKDDKGAVHYLKIDETEITEKDAKALSDQYLSGSQPLWKKLLDYEQTFKKATNAPKLKAIQNVYGGVKVSWEELPGEKLYRVFRKKVGTDTEWRISGDTSETEYVDKLVESGQEYQYTVRSMAADGKSSTSYYDVFGLHTLYVAAPRLLEPQCTDQGVDLHWEKSEGAVNYRVFRKTDDDDQWKRLSDVATLFYTDTNVEEGKKYTYTVRAVHADSSTSVSSYDPNGVSVRYEAPVRSEAPSSEAVIPSEPAPYVPSTPSEVPEEPGVPSYLWIIIGAGAFLLAAGAVFTVLFLRRKKKAASEEHADYASRESYYTPDGTSEMPRSWQEYQRGSSVPTSAMFTREPVQPESVSEPEPVSESAEESSSQSPSFKFCAYCGKQAALTEKFCKYCGKSFLV